MKKIFCFVGGALGFALVLFSFRRPDGPAISRTHLTEYKKKNLISCSPDWESLKEILEEADIPPIPGAGKYSWKITTKNDSAQFYFNQGINMYYSFHIIEAMASFKKAAKMDPASAMLQWAQALAYGPNINDLGYAASPDALNASQAAVNLAATCTDKEKMLIAAQLVRYSADSTKLRSDLNQLYVDKMELAYDKYPNDADIAALYADALMLQHPWDLWKIDGTPKPWTPLIRSVLEKLLVKTPNHPGANHYYIHVMEPSPYFAKAIPSADRLGKLTPGLSHTVHMPSHIYLRSGNYSRGTAVNESAVNSYKNIIPLYGAVTANDFLYIIHNLHMQTNNAMLGGRAAYSVKSAKATVESINTEYLDIPGPLGYYVQYIYMTPVLVDVRFGNWQALLDRVAPAKDRSYEKIIYHFGRGMAFANQSQLAKAKEELEKIAELKKDSGLSVPLAPFSASIEGAKVGEAILKGTIALKEGALDDAIASFLFASITEENLVYNEPRDWILNPRQYLGNAYLLAKQYSKARESFAKDLKNNNENVWSLYGLWQAMLGENKKVEAAAALLRYKKASAGSDIKITAPVF